MIDILKYVIYWKGKRRGRAIATKRSDENRSKYLLHGERELYGGVHAILQQARIKGCAGKQVELRIWICGM